MRSSLGMNKLHYVVIGKKGIAASKTKSLDEVSEYILKLRATSNMSPESYLIIYYLHYTGEIVYDRLKLSVKENFPNTVDQILYWLFFLILSLNS